MGRVTDGSCNIYTKDNPFIKNNYNYSYNNDAVACYINAGVNLTYQILGSILSGTKNADGTDKPEANAPVAGNDNVDLGPSPQDIANLLAKYDVNAGDNVDPNYSDVEIALEQKKKELAQLETQYKTDLEAYETAKNNYDTAVAKKTKYESQKAAKAKEKAGVDATIDSKKESLTKAETESTDLYNQIESLKHSDSAKTDAVQTEIKRLQEEKKKKDNEVKKLRNELGYDDNDKQIEGKGLFGKQDKLTKEIEEIDKNITGLNVEQLESTMSAAKTKNVEAVEAYRAKVAEIEKDLKTLDAYFGKKSIKNQQNAETETIVKLLKSYNKEKDETKRAAIEKEIKGSIVVYRTKHFDGANPTVDRFIKLFEEDIKSGSATNAL